MAGIVGYAGRNAVFKNAELLKSMSQSVQYLESDTTDQWADEHLAISRVHHGIVNREKQPIFNEDKSMLIFMDGEIFDYEGGKQLLIKKGHQFKYRHNDAEFCLHLYEQFGKSSFMKLNGSFLIAIYNLVSKVLLLVNDRFSSLPLYYCVSNGGLTFGAQLKAILQSHIVPRDLDFGAIVEFFTFNRILGTKTYYREMKVMPPATILTFGNGRISFKTYWHMSYQEDRLRSSRYYADALGDSLKQAVARRTNDEYRHGILLSGGLDARAVLGASGRSFLAYTIGDFENREVKIAKKLANAKGCKFSFFKRHLDHYVNLVEKAVELGDGMYSFQHGHFIGFLDRIRSECDILFHGYALDILFQGLYLPNRAIHILGKKIDLPIRHRLSDTTLSQAIFTKLKNSLWSKNPMCLFNIDLVADLRKKLHKSVQSVITHSLNSANDPHNRHDYFVYGFPARHFTYLNIMSIRHFMDQRTVAFDNDLFDLYLKMPPKLRFNGRIYKKALRKIDSSIGQIPNANTGLSPTTPDYIEFGINFGAKIIRKIHEAQLPHPSYTQGSWPNMPQMIRYNDKLKQFIWDVIHDNRCMPPTIFNRIRLIEIFEEHLARRADYTWFLFLILTFGLWHRKYGP